MAKIQTRIVVKVYNIDWDTSDTDGPKPKNLPKSVKLDLDICDIEDTIRTDHGDVQDVVYTDIGDQLSDKYGWCVNAFEWCFV